MNRIGIHLRELRQEKDLTLRDVEQMTGISNSFISQVELGTRRASADLLMTLAEAYEVPPSTLLELNAAENEAVESQASEQIDYSAAFRQIIKQQLGESAWAFNSSEYEKVPLGLKKLFVEQQLAKNIPVEKPSVKIVVRHSQNKFSGTIELKESDLHGAVFVRAKLAVQLMHPLDASWWEKQEGIRALDEKNVAFEEIRGQRYYDLLNVLRMQHRWGVSGESGRKNLRQSTKEFSKATVERTVERTVRKSQQSSKKNPVRE